MCFDQKARTASVQSFTLWQQAITEITLILLVHVTYICVLLFAHIPFVVNRTFNATSNERLQQCPLLFCSEPHLSHILFVNVEPGTTATSWSKHHFVEIGKPRRQVCKASHWQQATIEILIRDHSISACLRHIYMGVVLHVHPVRGESHIQHNTNRVVATLATKLG